MPTRKMKTIILYKNDSSVANLNSQTLGAIFAAKVATDIKERLCKFQYNYILLKFCKAIENVESDMLLTSSWDITIYLNID